MFRGVAFLLSFHPHSHLSDVMPLRAFSCRTIMEEDALRNARYMNHFQHTVWPGKNPKDPKDPNDGKRNYIRPLSVSLSPALVPQRTNPTDHAPTPHGDSRNPRTSAITSALFAFLKLPSCSVLADLPPHPLRRLQIASASYGITPIGASIGFTSFHHENERRYLSSGPLAVLCAIRDCPEDSSSSCCL